MKTEFFYNLLNLLYLSRILKMMVQISAGSIPDSYDIYRYLNLVRYSIFDTRYIRRKCNFVYIFRGYLKRLRHKKVHKKKDYFSNKKMYETLRGKRNPDFFSRKCDFFRRSDLFLSKIRFFFKTYKIRGGGPLLYTTFRKHTKSGVWSLSEFPCFIVYAVRNIPSIFDTMWCKAEFILRTP